MGKLGLKSVSRKSDEEDKSSSAGSKIQKQDISS